MANTATRCIMEVADVSKKEGIVVMPTTVSDPPEEGGVKAVPTTGKGNPSRNAGIVVRKATKRVSVGRSALIRRNPHPDLGGPNREINRDRTMLRALSELQSDRARPS